jgi:hypothetical protein
MGAKDTALQSHSRQQDGTRSAPLKTACFLVYTKFDVALSQGLAGITASYKLAAWEPRKTPTLHKLGHTNCLHLLGLPIALHKLGAFWVQPHNVAAVDFKPCCCEGCPHCCCNLGTYCRVRHHCNCCGTCAADGATIGTWGCVLGKGGITATGGNKQQQQCGPSASHRGQCQRLVASVLARRM